MVYKFQEWSLYKTMITHLNGEIEPVYFFSKREPIRGTPCNLPKKYRVIKNERLGVPYLVFKEN